MQLFDLDGKVALVTGGNGGIGLGVATGLGAAGAQVVLCGRDEEKGKQALAQLEAQGVSATFVRNDVGDAASCAATVNAAVEQTGRLDILVNNAGIHLPEAAAEMSMRSWHDELAVNLTAPFLLCQAAHPYLAKRGGKVLNIRSLASRQGMTHGANYCASKGGLVQLTQALAVEWGPAGIQVNAILPRWISTDITAPAQHGVAGFEQMIVDRTPARRWGQPADLAGTAVFLASSASHRRGVRVRLP
ncbi:SDR family NAD(P)-dependent oxidoreductase [Streptomyces spiralis]|uniref:SDR family NAD(P)-dependent oxidoreductase n=1 Tax=Streptomyces spiralis TaxID=66376 RepID=UPI0033E2BA8D